MAVKVTASPAQIVEPLDVIATDATTLLCTVMLIELLVAVNGLAHAALLVRMTVTTSPFAKVFVVNVAEFVPAFVPFTCH